MHCLKCGSEIDDNKVFCDACAEEMKKYPVKPGTPIQLPSHADVAPVKAKQIRWKRKVKAEDQVRRLRTKVIWLSIALFLVVAAFGVAVYMVIHLLNQRDAAEAMAFVTGLDAFRQAL